ncbi:hypothetical protein [Comamonas terrigena]|uniref:hypothetical protein n=1 Tax=Comamonas terrigena TaxID=32013 RepID=UPI0028A1F0C8|nr:hypothetical protein [Comamonas terrigena]
MSAFIPTALPPAPCAGAPHDRSDINNIIRYGLHRCSAALQTTNDGNQVFTASNLNPHFAVAVQPGQEHYERWRLRLPKALPAGPGTASRTTARARRLVRHTHHS